jgi:hypothetical protein
VRVRVRECCESAARVKTREVRRQDAGGSGSAESLLGAFATLRGWWSGECSSHRAAKREHGRER